VIAAEEFSTAKSKAYKTILWGGLIAGALDIVAALVNAGLQGRSPLFVLQSIASGLLGRDSYTGGIPAAALGLFIHFLIAFTATTVYYVASRKFRVLIRKAIICGVLYGITVYLFMYGVVLPLTFQRNFFRPFSAVATGVFIHMLCVGLPIALVVRRHSESDEQSV
jgi:uncharacterized membrane protein YagU involved in acid resistance